MKSFTQKKLRVTFVMAGADQVFPGTNSNTLILENFRISVRVEAVARLSTEAELHVYGMLPADMNALTISWAQAPIVLDNQVLIEADSGNGYVQIFKGTIIEAQPNFQGAPNVSFDVLAVTGYIHRINPAEPTSYPATTDVGVVVENIVNRMNQQESDNWSFVNGGATGVIAEGAYFWGSLWDQLAQICAATKTDYYVFGDTVLITPFGQPRDSSPTVLLNPNTGLVGYPMFERSGLRVSAIFDPAFLCGTPVEIGGTIPAATGRWYPYKLVYLLESRVPNGQWAAQMMCNKVFS